MASVQDILAAKQWLTDQQSKLATLPPEARAAQQKFLAQQAANIKLLEGQGQDIGIDPKFDAAQKWIDEQRIKLPVTQANTAWLDRQQGNLEMLKNPGAPSFDPALSAFLRSMGVTEQDIRAQARQQTTMLQNAYDRQVPVFTENLRVATEGVANDAEARGVLASGATALNTTYARNAVLRDQEIARGNMVDAQATVNLDALRRITDVQRRKAEAELEARTRQQQAMAQSAYGARE